MKQKISVRALIKQDDKTLFVRRSSGRQSILGKYELPGGSIAFREQPDEALRRYIYKNLGSKVETLQLYDVVSYIDPDNTNIQYIFIIYLVSLTQGEHGLRLAGKYDKYTWKKVSDLQLADMTSSTELLTEVAPPSLHGANESSEHQNADDEVTTKYIVYTDGGSRGNPGPSSTGYVVMDTSERIIEEGGSYLGVTTNNQAEYQAVLLGLQRAHELGATVIDFRVDSMLIVNQMKGVYQVKNRDLWPIYERIKELLRQFEKVSFVHVPRELNRRADAMVNKILDEHTASGKSPNRL